MTSLSTDIDERFRRAARYVVESAPGVLGKFSRDDAHADLFLSASSHLVVERLRSPRLPVKWDVRESADFGAALNVVSGQRAFLGSFDPLKPGSLSRTSEAACSIIRGRGSRIVAADPAPAYSAAGVSPEQARMYLDELGDALSDVLDPYSMRIAFDAHIRKRLVIALPGEGEESGEMVSRVIVNGRFPAGGTQRALHLVAEPEDAGTCLDIVERVRSKVSAAGDIRPIPSGTYDVIMRSGWAGTWIHEVVGHMLEADLFFQGPFNGSFGSKIAPPSVTVLDGPGSRALDDEGWNAAPSTLIEDGMLVGLIADQRTARRHGLTPTGNGIRASAGKPPLPRMTTIRLADGSGSLGDLMRRMNSGVLIDDFRSAHVLPDGTVRIEGAGGQRIEAGKASHRVDGLTLRGTALDWLRGIRFIAGDSETDETRGICAKKGQLCRVITTAPSALIDGITVEQT